MATTREQIDSRGQGLLQLLIDNETEMANLMNPSADANKRNTYLGPNPDTPVDIVWPRDESRVGQQLGDSQVYFLREYK